MPREAGDPPQQNIPSHGHYPLNLGHVALCMVAYLVVERECLDQRRTWVRLKRHLILTGASQVLPALERVRQAA